MIKVIAGSLLIISSATIVVQINKIATLEKTIVDNQVSFSEAIIKAVNDENKRCIASNTLNLSDSDIINELRAKGWIKN